MIFRTTKCDCSLLCWSRTHRNIHSTLQTDGKDWQWTYQWNHRHLQWSHATQAGPVFHGITYYQLFLHYFFTFCCVFRLVNRCFACHYPVEIIFFNIFTYFSVTKGENRKKMNEQEMPAWTSFLSRLWKYCSHMKSFEK